MVSLGKGELAEEALRNYFLERDYFVIRGLPFSYAHIDITDVDLWLYSKSSIFTRERINVDVKNKNNPQAFERIIWARGLQATLQLEASLVATTSNRREVREFGLANNVIIIDGNLLNNIISNSVNSDRVPEESFLAEISIESYGEGENDWKRRYIASKGRLLSKLNFDGCNESLREINYYLEESILRCNRSLVPLRLLYLNVALFLIGLDFISKNFAPLSTTARSQLLINGFNYGERGKERTESITNAAIKLASSVIMNQSLGATLRMEVDKQLRGRPVDILSDFFCKEANLVYLFEAAKLFESFSFSSTVVTPSKLPPKLQSILSILSDFLHVDRKKALF